ncbi:hypothetical protein CO651_22975 [Rhizobium phaseoli]|nr:hypothetical protein CO651_22975 [Rhizobium phaseoli]
MLRCAIVAAASLCHLFLWQGAAVCEDLDGTDLPGRGSLILEDGLRFELPKADTIIGPIVMSCDQERRCLPDTPVLESTTGLVQRDLSNDNIVEGTYVFGTAAGVKLGITPVIKAILQELFEAANRDYAVWASVRNPRADDVDLPGDTQIELSNPARVAIIDYPKTVRGKRCSIAVKAYRKANGNTEFHLTPTLRAVTQSIYRTECLKIDELASHHVVFKRLVYFIDGNQIACAGFMIGNGVVVTARHCFAPGEDAWLRKFEKNQQMPPALEVTDVPGRLAFVVGSKKQYEVRLIDDPMNGDLKVYNPAVDASKDFLFVMLENYDGPSFPDVKFDHVRPDDRLIIPGLFVEPKQLTPDFSPQKHLLVDDSPACVAAATIDTCVIHACQTDLGYSGTPIFKKISNGLAFVGVHTGNYSSTVAKPCGFNRKRCLAPTLKLSPFRRLPS